MSLITALSTVQLLAVILGITITICVAVAVGEAIRDRRRASRAGRERWETQLEAWRATPKARHRQ